MALTERNRSALYQGLSTIVDEEAVQEMLSYFPARDVEEPVTKEFLRAELSGVESSIRTDISAMELRLNDRINRAMGWNIATMIAMAAVIVAAIRV